MMQECGVLLKIGEYLEEKGKALSFLSREKWIEDGAVVSLASPTLIQSLWEFMNLKGARGVSSPLGEFKLEKGVGKELDEQERRLYSTGVGELQRIAKDLFELLFPVKELARGRTRPT
eukprot:5722655-Alexandrium_andersonii.AAC.1